MKLNQNSDYTGLGRKHLSHTTLIQTQIIRQSIEVSSMAIKWIFLSILFLSFSFGQNMSISGLIVNEKGKKFGVTRIVLYNGKKQKIEEQTTSSNGKYKFKKLESGEYTLNVYGDGSFSATEKVSLSGSNVSKLNIQPTKDAMQPQLSVDLQSGGVSLSWTGVAGVSGYKVYRNNDAIKDVSGTSYFDEVKGGEVYSYTIAAVESDDTVGPRSITEYGKALFPYPDSFESLVKKNAVLLSWEVVEGASAYNVYRDGELLTTTTDNGYDDYDLKYEKQYSYELASVDWVKSEGPRSNKKNVTTHPELKALKKINAEPGENSVLLSWEKHSLAHSYFIYQNGEKIDSTQSTTYTAKTEAGSENCFNVTPKDQFGTEGAQTKPACDKSQYSPPEDIIVAVDLNTVTLSWELVEGASTYNIYRDGKEISNTVKSSYKDIDLKFGKTYKYEISSLAGDGAEGPLSSSQNGITPPAFEISGALVNEDGQSKIEEAKIFLYTSADNKLKDEYVAGSNGKFKFSNAIIPGDYIIKAFGNGSGNGGKNITIKNSDMTGLSIPLSTDGLKTNVTVERGVQSLTIKWTQIPQAETYNIYKNDKLIGTQRENVFVDQVAPGSEVCYIVRGIDMYDLEGPISNKVCEKSSYNYPELVPNLISGGLTEEGSGRHLKLFWTGVPEVSKYSLYKDNQKISTQDSTGYFDASLKYGTEYQYQVSSYDGDGDEGVLSPNTSLLTHPEIVAPIITTQGDVNAIKVSWPVVEHSVLYKVFRNGGYLTDVTRTFFIDNVPAGSEYCYSISAEDSYGTEGPKSDIKCAKGMYAPPATLSGDILKNTIALSWPSVNDVAGYHLYRNDSLVVETKDLSFMDEGLAFDTRYDYKIASYDNDGDDGPYSNLTLTTHEEVIAPILSGTADLESIHISWSKLSLKVDHKYRIYRDGAMIKELTDTSYVDNVTPGQFYCYSISCVDAYGTEGPKSNEECLKIMVNYPDQLSIVGDVKRVIFKWKKMIGAELYHIYRVNKESGENTFLTSTKGNYYEHKGLEFDTEYCYSVSSIDQDNEEGPQSPTMCDIVLPPPHISLIDVKFVEESGNNLLDGRENALFIARIVNDGRSPARELKPWLEPLGESLTPSLILSDVPVFKKLDVNDTLTISFSIFAKLKIESGERKFNIRVDEWSGQDLKPKPVNFTTLAVVPPNMVIADYAIDNEIGAHYIPRNEIVTMTVRFQNLSIGKTDTAFLKLNRDPSFTIIDHQESYGLGMIPGGDYIDFSFNIFSKEEEFSIYFDTYDYFGVKKIIPIHLKTMTHYKGVKDLATYDVPMETFVQPGMKEEKHTLLQNIPSAKTDRDVVGVVLGNQAFWSKKIHGKSSAKENVKLVRKYFGDLLGVKDHMLYPSQSWTFDDGISKVDLYDTFDPDFGYIRKKMESSQKYSQSDSIDLIIYFSGEGTTIDGEKCLIPLDADQYRVSSFYPVSQLYASLNELKKLEYVGNITLFMDVDFNNPSFKPLNTMVVKPTEDEENVNEENLTTQFPEQLLPDELLPPEGITAFYASNIFQKSYDHIDENNGLFTYYLLKGLKGEADNGDKIVTVEELYTYVAKNVYDTTATLYGADHQVPLLFADNPNQVLFRFP